MTTPIKPGTAQRMGLRKPQDRPCLVQLRMPPLTAGELEQLAISFRAAAEKQYRITVLQDGLERSPDRRWPWGKRRGA